MNRVAATIIVLLAMPGCTSDPASSKIIVETSAASAEAPLGDAVAVGALAGNVLDEEFRPVVGATIEICGTVHNATSDEAGQYQLEAVPVGRHHVDVRAPGFEAHSRVVQIVEASVTKTDFRLRLLEGIDPVLELIIQEGFIMCDVNLGSNVVRPCGPLGNDDNAFTYQQKADLFLAEIVLEVAWSATTLATGQRLDVALCGGGTEPAGRPGVQYCPVGTDQTRSYRNHDWGRSPLVLREKELPVSGEPYGIHVTDGWIHPQNVTEWNHAPATVQQDFTLFISACYVVPCGDEYQGRPE